MPPDLLELLANSLRTEDEEDGRIYGFQVGTVTEIVDPKSLGRIKARVMAQEKGESSDWLMPAWPAGVEAKPRVGEPVLVTFLDGDPNKGIWFWTVTSKSLNRPSEFMVLGTTLIGCYNDLVQRFNDLRTAFIAHRHNLVDLQAGGSAVTQGAPGVDVVDGTRATGTAPPSAASKLKAADGATVADKTGSQIVLSGEAKVR
jgi:hypothetical protein